MQFILTSGSHCLVWIAFLDVQYITVFSETTLLESFSNQLIRMYKGFRCKNKLNAYLCRMQIS